MSEALKTSKTQLQRREEAISKILDSAITLISEKGVKDLTMAEIGIFAGYSRGLPHQYFGSKDNLIESVLRTIIERFNERRRKIKKSADGVDSIKTLVSAYLERAEEDWKASKAFIILISDPTLTDGPLREFINKHHQRNIEFIVRHLGVAKELGQIRNQLPEQDLAIIIMGTLRGIALQALTDKQINLKSINQSMNLILDQLFN